MKKRIARLIATLALASLAATGYALSDDLAATPQSDSGWGAGDTADTAWTTPPAGTGTDTTLGDSGWG